MRFLSDDKAIYEQLYFSTHLHSLGETLTLLMNATLGLSRRGNVAHCMSSLTALKAHFEAWSKLTHSQELPLFLFGIRRSFIIKQDGPEDVFSENIIETLARIRMLFSKLQINPVDYFDIAAGKESEFAIQVKRQAVFFDEVFIKFLPEHVQEKVKEGEAKLKKLTVSSSIIASLEMAKRKKLLLDAKMEFLAGYGRLKIEPEEELQSIISYHSIQRTSEKVANILREIGELLVDYEDNEITESGKKMLLKRLFTQFNALHAFAIEWNKELRYSTEDEYIEADHLLEFYSTIGERHAPSKIHPAFESNNLLNVLNKLAFSLTDIANNITEVFTIPDDSIRFKIAELSRVASGLTLLFPNSAEEKSKNHQPEDFIRESLQIDMSSLSQTSLIARSIVEMPELRKCFRLQDYDNYIKGNYIGLIAGLSQLYQQNYGGFRLFKQKNTLQEHELKSLLKKLVKEITDKKALPLYPRLNTILDEHLERGNRDLIFLTKPYIACFKKNIIVRDIEGMDEEHLKASVKFKITRNIMETLQKEGYTREGRREKATGILSHLWSKFLSCFGKAHQKAIQEEAREIQDRTEHSTRKSKGKKL